MTSDLQARWQAVCDSIGTDYGPNPTAQGADAIEPGGIRRYLESLEFDCALHFDCDAARSAGHTDIIAPYTSVQTFSLPPIWVPGEEAYSDPGRDSVPAAKRLPTPFVPGAPPTSAWFAASLDADYVRPPRIGDRLSRRGMKLLSCAPKRT